jgi:ribonuclease-3
LFQTQNLVVKLFGNQATTVDRDDIKDNFKAELQEITQAQAKGTPVYEVLSIEGPPHDPVFCVSVQVDDKLLASGSGKSKKAAEQEAAKTALLLMSVHTQKLHPAT